MAQTVGKVNVVVKNHVGYYDDAGTAIIGDGNTADDVSPREAANLAKADAIVADSDVLMDIEDFKKFVKSLDAVARG